MARKLQKPRKTGRNTLTEKQRRFVMEYVKDFNAAQAAIRAGYSQKGATVRGSELLANRKVAIEVAKFQARAEEKAILTLDQACEILTEIAVAPVAAYLGEGDTLDIEAIRTKFPRAVESVEVTESARKGRVTKFRLAPRVQAIERLAKLLGWDKPEKHEHSGMVVFRDEHHDGI